ncbi:MAG: hypothetical protein IPI32_01990 [Austwickia sp.]|jgi:hypothetical protein|nr:hypothetical protein [Austwickia sp.]MBK8437730.1 hypothetical protein [Austwickia sp.]MBK9100039.1 hypothetical protein [Austwickia sp.]
MPAAVKKVLVWVFWIFIIYSVLTAPDRAADIVRTAWSIVINGGQNILRFFSQVLGG